MLTLCIRYSFDPDKRAAFEAYVAAEQGPIERAGGRITGYFMPTDFAGSNNEALGLIDMPDLAAYERYRRALAEDADHKRNVTRLLESDAHVVMARSFIVRVAPG